MNHNQDPHRLLQAVLRTDFRMFVMKVYQTVSGGSPFLDNWHLDAMAYEIGRVLDGNNRRLLMTIPPRHLKSITVSVALPAFILGHNPHARLICVSYSSELSKKHAADCRAVIESDWYRALFPHTFISDRKNTETEIRTTKGGFRLTTSVGGTITGRGANYIVLDDPMKPDDAMSEPARRKLEQWYVNTLLSRLDDKNNGAIILIMQRLHVDDFANYLLEQGGWTHLNLPAIAEAAQSIAMGPDQVFHRPLDHVLHAERESRETLEKLKREMGPLAFSAQYQQDPVVPDGNIVKKEWFRYYAFTPELTPSDQIVISWDTASKPGEHNDYSVGTIWLKRGKDFYLLDVVRRKVDYPTLKRLILNTAHRFNDPVTLIEDKGSGTQLIQDFRHDGTLRPIGIVPKVEKLIRMSAQSAKINAGQVFLPERATWLEEFIKELLQFPQGKHDDQVDSVSQFLEWASKPQRSGPSVIQL